MDIKAKLSVPQAEFIKRSEDPLVLFQAGVGSGKTFIASIYLISNMLKGRRMVAGALNHSALMKTLFRQTYELAWKWGLKPVINKQDKTLVVGDGITFGYSNDAPDSVLGLSDIYGLVLDEASRCCELFFNNLSDRLRGEGLEEPHKRLITSPCSEPNSAWYNDLCKKHPEAIIKASLLSNPFVSQKYIDELTERYGKGSDLYRQQVLGETIETDFLNAILKDSDFGEGGLLNTIAISYPYYMGMDVSGMGRDYNCLSVVNERGLVSEEAVQNLDTQGKETLIINSFERYKWNSGAIDATGGFSEGVYDSVKLKPNLNIRQVTFSEKPSKEIYRNVRSQMYMELAQCVRDGFYIDRNEFPLLVEELRNTQCYIDEIGKLRIIPKEDIKKLIGRSPDRGDALALAVYAMNHNEGFSVSRALNTLNKLKSMGVV